MTDLERVRDFVLAMADAEMLDIIDAHLKEDVERDRHWELSLGYTAKDLKLALAQLAELRGKLEARGKDAEVFRAWAEDYKQQRDELREAVRDWSKHTDDYDRVNRLRQLIEEKE